MIKLQKLTPKAEAEFKKICQTKDLFEYELKIEDFKTSNVELDIEIDKTKIFNNKFELVEYLYSKLKDLEIIENSIWHFLVIVYYKQLISSKVKNGVGKGLDRFFIKKERTYYPHTHLLKAPFDFYSFYTTTPQDINFLLLNPVNEGGQLLLEIIKRQDIMKNKNFIEVVKTILYDKRKKKIKRGFKDGILRLIDLFKQYERSYDLYSMPAKDILEKLIVKHKEFNKFKTGLFNKTF